jgi:hypothetical protein
MPCIRKGEGVDVKPAVFDIRFGFAEVDNEGQGHGP